jgi:hypothetical protein
MDIKEIRRDNARWLLAQDPEGKTGFMDKTEKDDSRVSQIIGKNPIKNIGHKTAREIEIAYEKPRGWLDIIHAEVKYSFAVQEESAEYSASVKPGSDPLAKIWKNINTLRDPELIKELNVYVNYLIARQKPEKKQRKSKHL